MSSQRQNSAFKPTRVEASELLRQKRVLTRDDSGIFSSSPSPLTPSRPLSVFPPPDPTPSEAMSVSDNTAYSGLSGRSPSTTAAKMGQTNGRHDGLTHEMQVRSRDIHNLPSVKVDVHIHTYVSRPMCCSTTLL